MTTLTTPTAERSRPAARLRSWQTAAGLTTIAAGAAIVTGALLPWVETFAGLIGIPGIRGINGRILAAAGILVAAAGIWHLVRGGQAARWLIGIAGCGALGFSAYLLIQLTRSMSVLGGDSMVVARGGPGLWVAAGGSAAAFATLFLPPSPQGTLRRPAATGPALAWAADRDAAGLRRGLQVALGLMWLLDAALQYQPYMFSRNFVTSVLEPASMGNPALLAGPAAATARIVAHDVVAWNAAFATIQLSLAAGLLWRRTARAALQATIGRALAVWLLAEGAGGTASGMPGMANPLTGSPGAAVLLALLALLALPRRPGRHTGASAGASVAAVSLLGLRWARAAWVVLWGSLAFFMLRPGVWSAAAMRGTFSGLAAGEPHWLAGLNNVTATAFSQHASLASITLAAAFVLAGAGVVWGATARPALVLAVLLALFIWVAGEDFGGVLTGHATDPGSGPPLILLAAAFWPRRRAPARRRPRGRAPTRRRPRAGTAISARAAGR